MTGTFSTAPRLRALAAALFLAAFAGPAAAAPTGEEIARESDRRQRSRTLYYEGKIRVIDAKGRVKDKGWRFWRKGYGGESTTITQFTSPAEVAGVGLLTVARRGREDDQWMWTPAIQRERRIAAQEKSTRFLGTDFTYEDLQERIVEDWDYTLEGEEPCEGGRCWIVASVPHAGKKSQYSRSRSWFRQSDHALVKAELHVGAAPRRILTLGDHRTLQGIVTAHRIAIADLERGSRTELTLTDVRYDVPLDDAFFSVRSLRETLAPPR